MKNNLGQLLRQTSGFRRFFFDTCIRVYNDGEENCTGRGRVKSIEEATKTFSGQLIASAWSGSMCTFACREINDETRAEDNAMP